MRFGRFCFLARRSLGEGGLAWKPVNISTTADFDPQNAKNASAPPLWRRFSPRAERGCEAPNPAIIAAPLCRRASSRLPHIYALAPTFPSFQSPQRQNSGVGVPPAIVPFHSCRAQHTHFFHEGRRRAFLPDGFVHTSITMVLQPRA